MRQNVLKYAIVLSFPAMILSIGILPAFVRAGPMLSDTEKAPAKLIAWFDFEMDGDNNGVVNLWLSLFARCNPGHGWIARIRRRAMLPRPVKRQRASSGCGAIRFIMLSRENSIAFRSGSKWPAARSKCQARSCWPGVVGPAIALSATFMALPTPATDCTLSGLPARFASTSMARP